MMYKISRSIVTIDDSLFIFTVNSQTRGKFKVFKLRCTNNAREFSFSCGRVIVGTDCLIVYDVHIPCIVL